MGRLAAALALLYPLLAAVPLKADEAQLRRLEQQYNEQLARGEFTQAIATSRQRLALAQRDSNLAAWVPYVENDLGWALLQDRRLEEAEPLFRKAIGALERSLGREHADVAYMRSNLAMLHKERRDWPAAEGELRAALAIREKGFGREAAELLWTLNELVDCALMDERWDEAETQLRRVGGLVRRHFPADAPEQGWQQMLEGRLQQGRGKGTEAAERFQRAVELFAAEEHRETRIDALWGLANAQAQSFRYEEAVATFRRAEALVETVFRDRPALRAARRARLLIDHANVVSLTRDYPEAEKLIREALELSEQRGGAQGEELGHTMHQFGHLYHDRGLFAQAEQAMRRALTIFQKTLGPEDILTIHLMNDTGHQLAHSGRFVEAEALHVEALRASERHTRPQHLWREVAGLGFLYLAQGRYEAAEPVYRRALALVEEAFGPDCEHASEMRHRLAEALLGLERYPEAEAMARRALAIAETHFGPEGIEVCDPRDQLASVYLAQERFEEAERLLRRSIEVITRKFGPASEELIESESLLVELLLQQKRYEEAEPLVDRVLAQVEQSQAAPATRHGAYTARAEIAWALGHKSDALADLRTAMTLAEQHRLHVSGAEHERARAFEKFSDCFELMVSWQAELGDPSEALNAIERGRARSLLDELMLQGADLHAGSTSVERETLRLREAELAGRAAALEQQLRALTERGAAEAERTRLRGQLAEARAALYEFHRDQRSSSPIYRGLLSLGSAPPRLSQVRREALREGELLLEYMIGKRGSFVVAAGLPRDLVLPLTVEERDARALGIEPGPLTLDRLNGAFANEAGTGVLQRLKTPAGALAAAEQLAALYTVLIPEALREPLTGGDCRRLIVIPDGPLALLPFETLVVRRGEAEHRYLLEAGPPVQYAPSVSVLLNLARRKEADSVLAAPVLTVGAPNYPRPAGADPAALLASSTRYAELGGALRPLPYTRWETSWVDEVFGKRAFGTRKLIAAEATEKNVRREIAGRMIVHLACHGLADQQFGNFFGSLALTPGPRGDAEPDDDGFLTLAEIYGLDLAACQLAILSACDTNYGPQQRGEGVWALSRGFLVAGARRVVASNWLVDDEAAASQMSLLCGRVAQGMRDDNLDCAQALHQAKLYVRRQEKWRSPYYWGTFVLIGPQ